MDENVLSEQASGVRLIRNLLSRAVANQASDVHIVAGLPPLQRIHTVLAAMEGERPVGDEESIAFVKDLLTEKQYAQFTVRRDFDFSAALADGTRFRVKGRLG